MRRFVAGLAIVIGLSMIAAAATAGIDDAVNADILIVSGVITNTHNEAVAGAEVSLVIAGAGGKTSRETISDDTGRFEIKSLFPSGSLDMPPSIAALLGATGLLLTSRLDIVGLLEKKIEWSTLVFFAALFIVVAAAEQSGLIHLVADGVKTLSTDALVTAVILVLWVSAIVSAVIDNIPFTATMLPVVGYLTSAIPGADGGILWWALALGACLGGNGTIIGASANVVTVGMAEKAGYRITFLQYAKICFLPMIISIAVSTFWLLYKLP